MDLRRIFDDNEIMAVFRMQKIKRIFGIEEPSGSKAF